jgi:hypothetical protein
MCTLLIKLRYLTDLDISGTNTRMGRLIYTTSTPAHNTNPNPLQVSLKTALSKLGGYGGKSIMVNLKEVTFSLSTP